MAQSDDYMPSHRIRYAMPDDDVYRCRFGESAARSIGDENKECTRSGSAADLQAIPSSGPFWGPRRLDPTQYMRFPEGKVPISC